MVNFRFIDVVEDSREKFNFFAAILIVDGIVDDKDFALIIGS